jgi:hypothetical protein
MDTELADPAPRFALLPLDRACAEYGVARQAVLQAAVNEELVAYKVKRAWVINRTSLEAWIARHRYHRRPQEGGG